MKIRGFFFKAHHQIFHPEILQNYSLSTILIFINAIYLQENTYLNTYESVIVKDD